MSRTAARGLLLVSSAGCTMAFATFAQAVDQGGVISERVKKLTRAIKWTLSAEDWCRLIFKVGDKYYGVGRLDDNAPASEFEISK